MFENVLLDECNIAEKGANLVTIGITPDYPETGYGHIKINADVLDGRAFGVECLSGMVLLDTDDATLICDKGSTGEIKKVVENLKLYNRNEYI